MFKSKLLSYAFLLKSTYALQSDISCLIDQFTVCLRISSCHSASLASSWCTILSERFNSSSNVELLLLFLPADDFYYFWRCNLQMSTVVCNWPPPSASNIMATTLDLYSTPYTQRKSIHPPQLTISAGPAVDRTYALVAQCLMDACPAKHMIAWCQEQLGR